MVSNLSMKGKEVRWLRILSPMRWMVNQSCVSNALRLFGTYKAMPISPQAVCLSDVSEERSCFVGSWICNVECHWGEIVFGNEFNATCFCFEFDLVILHVVMRISSCNRTRSYPCIVLPLSFLAVFAVCKSYHTWIMLFFPSSGCLFRL